MRTVRLQVIAVGAVFLALGAGLAVGTVVHRRPTTVTVPDTDTATQTRNHELQASLDRLRGDVAAQQRFADGLAPVVLNGRLRGVKVTILSTPAGASDVDGVVAMLGMAGAVVAGRVQLADTFTDPGHATELLDLANRARPASVTGGPPTDGIGASTALLAAVLVARTPAVADGDIASVLAAYSGHGYLSVTGTAVVPGDAVVLVGGAAAGSALLTVVGQLRHAAPLVVADAAGTGVIAQIRADPLLSTTVSTVDDVTTPPGRLVTAWALADQLAGRTGHYGTAAGVSLLPPP
jgi:hypothetical protein